MISSNNALHQRSTYIYHDSIDRVYECFTNINLLRQFTEEPYKVQIELEDGDRFDNGTTLFIMNKTVLWRCKLLNCIITPYYRQYIHHYLPMATFASRTRVIVSFYYNTIEHETLYILDRTFDDAISQVNLNIDLEGEQNVKMCKKAEDYLNRTRSKIEQIESIVLYHSLDKLWSLVSHYESLVNYFLLLSGNDCGNSRRGWNLYPIKDIVKSNDQIIIQRHDGCSVKLIVRSIKKKQRRIRIIIEIQGDENMMIPRQMIRWFIEKIDESTCIFSFIHYSLINITYRRYCLIKDLKQKMLKNFNICLC